MNNSSMNNSNMNIETLLKNLTLEEKASLCSGEDFWHTKAIRRLGIPAVMMCDGPNGLRKQEGDADHLGLNVSVKAVCFPTSSAVAASFDIELSRRLGETLGRECQAENVSMLLGPGVNIKRSPLCGRNFEYYSEDPYQSSQMATAYIQGLQSQGVGACIKHFAANNQESHRQTGDSVVDERTLHEIYLASFEEAVKAGRPWGVMCSYNRINGTFAAENGELLTDILRTRWGYQGMVVTDWGAVKGRVNGILAGLDLEMPGGSGSLINDAKIVKAVQEGSLSMEELDKAVTNVLQFVEKAASQHQDGYIFDRDADYQTAKEAAAECAVLLKNEGSVLPLTRETKTAFIGGFVEKPRIQGSGSSFINSARVPNIAGLIQGNPEIAYARGFAVDAGGTEACSYAGANTQNAEDLDERLLAEAVELAKASEAAVIFAGLPGSFESEGADRTHMDLPANQNRLIAEVIKVQPNTVVVLANGSPVTMPWVDSVPAILEMYLAGDGAGEAAMELLYGEVNPSGKLAESFPLRLEDTSAYLNFPGEKGVVQYKEDIFVGYRYYDKKAMPVLFPFGHGLSYTTFSYSNLTLSADTVKDTETLTVSVTVTNTGAVTGKEVVQLYVGEQNSKVRRPVRELKGFDKIELAPGESRNVTFTLDKRSFAYYETAIHDWFVESACYEISVGSSSRDIRAAAVVQVEGTGYLPLTVSLETSIGELINYPATAAIMEQLIQRSIAQRHGSDSAEAATAAMGEGAGDLVAGAMEMPLGALLSFGVMQEEQLMGLIEMLQSAVNGSGQK